MRLPGPLLGLPLLLALLPLAGAGPGWTCHSGGSFAVCAGEYQYGSCTQQDPRFGFTGVQFQGAGVNGGAVGGSSVCYPGNRFDYVGVYLDSQETYGLGHTQTEVWWLHQAYATSETCYVLVASYGVVGEWRELPCVAGDPPNPGWGHVLP